MPNQDLNPLTQKLLGETALISWRDLQRFFAQGILYEVDIALDLIQLAELVANDQSNELKSLMDKSILRIPSNEQAREWFSTDQELWSVVVAPFVFVQQPKD